MALGWITLLALLAEPAPGRLAIIRSAPDFSLTSQDGKTTKLSDFRGKVLLVSFVFTTCNGTCPATTHRLAVIQQRLQKDEKLRDNVHFLSISLDPERDTPEVMAGYMRLYDLPAKQWTFLTGDAREVAKVHADWGMWVKPAANGQLDHPSRVFLVDTRGRIREIYNLDFLRVPWVVDDLETLLAETHRSS